MKPYKTDNIRKANFWAKRMLFVGLFLLFIYFNLPEEIEVKKYFFVVYILFVFIGQSDELEINDTQIIVSQNSLIPFFRSRREYDLKDIQSISVNEDTILADNIFVKYLYKRKNTLKVLFTNGKSEILNSNLHVNKQKGLVKEIITRDESANNKFFG